VREHAFDAGRRPGVRQQRVRRLDDDLADDQQVRIDEMVERVRDQPLDASSTGTTP
jgi:hypothetical protein